MSKSELISHLNLLGVHPDRYSLDGDLKPDAMILYENYHIWEVFYLDEKGNREEQKKFNSESEACSYLYKRFTDLKELREKFGIKLQIPPQ